MAIVHLRSKDGRFGIQIEQFELERMRNHCAKWAGVETGGILVGHYNSTRTCAVATKASLAPKDSRRGRTWFVRGIGQLQKWLKTLWHDRGEYYLGEWHYHPGGTANASGTDCSQMKEIALDANYGCPEPILFILAQPRPGIWQHGAFVFPAKEPMQTLE